jgi:hypothetical protein
MSYDFAIAFIRGVVDVVYDGFGLMVVRNTNVGSRQGERNIGYIE